MSFLSVFERYNWQEVQRSIASKTTKDVEHALTTKSSRTLDDFAALLSPAAAPYLETMAQLSHALTLKRFGRTIQLYIPLYLSNECQNICTYCGFSYDNKIERLTLDDLQILNEIKVIKSLGFDHVLLVTGEAPKKVGVSYFKNALSIISKHFSHVTMEVQPLDEDEYRELKPYGLSSVLVYQESYRRDVYKSYHPKGRKSNFEYRLDTPDRLGRAGIHKIGLGALIGLEDWRAEALFVALHLAYLRRTYWQTKYSISFPRLRPAQGVVSPPAPILDKELVQLICAYRIFDENVELSLSTRESESFRDNAVKLGITTMSAGSRTDPGGYASNKSALKQFEIDDQRSPAAVAKMLKAQGYEAIWKDWEGIFACQIQIAQ